MLIKLPDVLSGEVLNHIAGLLNNAEWQDGRSTAGTQAALVKNNQQLPEGNSTLKQIRTIILKVLQQDPLFFLPRYQNKFCHPSLIAILAKLITMAFMLIMRCDLCQMDLVISVQMYRQRCF